MKLTNIRYDYHRNGISGRPFYVCLFNWRDGNRHRHMVATLHHTREDANGRPVFIDTVGIECAVFDVDELAAGNIAFARGNSWRGDDFAPALHAFIRSNSCIDR